MKSKNLFVLTLITLALFLGAGCATVDKALFTPTSVVTPASTNAVTGAITPPSTNTTYTANPMALAATQGIAAAPFPFAGTVGIGLGWLLTGIAAIRSKKLSVALVQGIEAGRQILQTTPEGQKLDAKFKDALIANQDAAGVLNAAASLVNQYTGDTVKPTT
jgi:hypothetical protein